MEDSQYVTQLVQVQEILPRSLITFLNNFGSEKSEKEEIIEDSEEEEEKEESQTECVRPKNYSFLLTWISLILKIKVQLSNSPSNIETCLRKVILLYLSQNKKKYIDALNQIFQWIKVLNFTDTEQKNMVSPKSKELSSIVPEAYLIFFILIQLF